MGKKTGSGAGTRKFGRDAKKCQRYRSEGRREKNKEKKRLKEEKRQARFALYRERRKEKANKHTPVA